MQIIKLAIISAAVVFGTTVSYGKNAAAPAVGKLMTFKDWTVGCDNVLACQAVALAPENSSDHTLSVVIKRGESSNAPVEIELSGASKPSRYRLTIDGKPVATALVPRDDDFIRIAGGEARRIARLMSAGKTIKLLGGDGTEIGSASLSGASAALRYIDAQQGRAGTRGAIVAIGKGRAKPKVVSVPVITARKIQPTDQLPDAAALVALSESSPCAAERYGSTQDTAYSLGMSSAGPQALVLLNCGAGAYNLSSGVYVGQRNASGQWTFKIATFDYGAEGFSDDSKIPLLINADWDAATQTVSSFAKGRGIGDCGSSESWVWDGTSFRLTRATAMGECRLSIDWIPVWRAQVRFVP